MARPSLGSKAADEQARRWLEERGERDPLRAASRSMLALRESDGARDAREERAVRPCSLREYAEAIFAHRFRRPASELDIRRLATVAERAGRSWRAAIVRDVDRWGLRFDARPPLLPKIPRNAAVRRKGHRVRPMSYAADHAHTALDFALLAILIGKVRGRKHRSYEAIVRAEEIAMRRVIARHGKPGLVRGPASGERYPLR